MRADNFLDTAARVTENAKTLPTDPFQMLGAGDSKKAYEEAVGAKDLYRADNIYLDRLKILHLDMYDETLRMEALAREFSSDLADQVSKSRRIYRWADLAELESYRNGVFESKRRRDKSRRGCTLFSLGPNPYARKRPVSIEVRVDETIRRKLLPATYTALPWTVTPEKEDIHSRKHLVHAEETECRLPDGTPVPIGTRIFVQDKELRTRRDRGRYDELLESLKDVAEVRLT